MGSVSEHAKAMAAIHRRQIMEIYKYAGSLADQKYVEMMCHAAQDVLAWELVASIAREEEELRKMGDK